MNGGVPGDPATALTKCVNNALSYGVKYIEIYQIDAVNLTKGIANVSPMEIDRLGGRGAGGTSFTLARAKKPNFLLSRWTPAGADHKGMDKFTLELEQLCFLECWSARGSAFSTSSCPT